MAGISLITQNNPTITEINCGSSTPKLGGTINLSNFPNLTGFTCVDNGITSISGYANNNNLRLLNINTNNLSGPLLPFTNNTSLVNFQCHNNSITGFIPDLNNSNNWITFSVYQNKLSGVLPPSLSNQIQLIEFYAHQNKLSGTVPNLNNLIQLRRFLIADNQLSGSIPNLSNNINLVDCWFHVNNFTGSIPVPLNSLNLADYWFGANFLSGPIPSLTGVLNLRRFDCQYQKGVNKISGIIPSLANNPFLIYFNCGGNQLTGNIPVLTGNKFLSFFWCGDNSLSGPIPNLSQNTDLKEFYCFNNNLNGSIPSLAGLNTLKTFWCYNQSSFLNVINGNFSNLAGLTVNATNPAIWFDGLPTGWSGVNTTFTIINQNGDYIANLGQLSSGPSGNSFRQNLGILPTTSNVELTFTANQLFGASTFGAAIYDGSYNTIVSRTYNNITGTFTLTGVSIPANTNIIIGFWKIAGNPSLDNVLFKTTMLTGFAGGSISNTLGDFRANDNQLTSTAVNAILAAFVAAGRTTGNATGITPNFSTCLLNLGGVGNFRPTGQGVTDVTLLRDRGWTVTTGLL